MMTQESKGRQVDPKLQLLESETSENGGNEDSIFSPRFKSVAAMAGWDEETLLIASLVVDDTPDRELKFKKRSDLQFKSPPTSSRRKRRAQRRSPVSIPVTVLNLDEEEIPIKGTQSEKKETATAVTEKKEADVLVEQKSGASFSSAGLPCLDKLREELSCAICLEICFEPSTTSCGHSFCKKCLRAAADKCGKRCPKCRQLISNGRSCTVNTVLWNTIQLLFPHEVEARKAAGALNCREASNQSPETAFYNNLLNRNTRTSSSSLSSRDVSVRRRREVTIQDNNTAEFSQGLQREAVSQSNERRGRNSHLNRSTRSSRLTSTEHMRSRGGTALSQDEDAALALRLQREEFMEVFRETREHSTTTSSLSLARANLRAMASRAISLRARGRH